MRAFETSAVVVLGFVAALAWSPTLAAQSGEPFKWSEESWRTDLEQAAKQARVTHADAEKRLYALEGLSPEVYLERRRPEPEVARELSRLVERGVVPAVLLAELALQLDEGRARYPFSTEERLPKRAPADVERLRGLERAQLHAGLLLALGAVRHPSAFYLARDSLLADARALEQRRVAAMALGQTGDARALPLLARVVADEKAAVELRTSALAGLAQVRSLDAVRALQGLLEAQTDPTLQRAAALALGNVASAWALRARPQEEAGEMRALASTALVDLLVRTEDTRVHSAAVDALGMVAHEPAALRLRTLAADEVSSPALRERAAHAERRLTRALRRAAR